MEISAMGVAILFFVAGLAGTILPLLPGTPLILAGMVIYGAMTQFASLDTVFFVVQGVATAFTFLTDYLATAVGTQRFGGGRRAAIGTVVGSLVGLVTLGPLGLVVGCFAGAVLAELRGGKTPQLALRSGLGALVGFVGSIAVKLGISVGMIGWFFWRVM